VIILNISSHLHLPRLFLNPHRPASTPAECSEVSELILALAVPCLPPIFPFQASIDSLSRSSVPVHAWLWLVSLLRLCDASLQPASLGFKSFAWYSYSSIALVFIAFRSVLDAQPYCVSNVRHLLWSSRSA